MCALASLSLGCPTQRQYHLSPRVAVCKVLPKMLSQDMCSVNGNSCEQVQRKQYIETEVGFGLRSQKLEIFPLREAVGKLRDGCCSQPSLEEKSSSSMGLQLQGKPTQLPMRPKLQAHLHHLKQVTYLFLAYIKSEIREGGLKGHG